jgi:hypothetical protein
MMPCKPRLFELVVRGGQPPTLQHEEGEGTPESGLGNWHNPETGDTQHPDLGHAEPIGPHWDWNNKASGWKRGWRINPDGSIVPKK